VIANKGRPALIAARVSWWGFGHVFPCSAWRDANTQLEEQFIGNALLLFAQEEILGSESALRTQGKPEKCCQIAE
jgi:hypothetical protein